jgi:hypothetical protein
MTGVTRPVVRGSPLIASSIVVALLAIREEAGPAWLAGRQPPQRPNQSEVHATPVESPCRVASGMETQSTSSISMCRRACWGRSAIGGDAVAALGLGRVERAVGALDGVGGIGAIPSGALGGADADRHDACFVVGVRMSKRADGVA